VDNPPLTWNEETQKYDTHGPVTALWLIWNVTEEVIDKLAKVLVEAEGYVPGIEYPDHAVVIPNSIVKRDREGNSFYLAYCGDGQWHKFDQSYAVLGER
jgi:hypothetical protein